MGLILYLLTKEDETEQDILYCQILRDTESLSLGTTNIWAIISIMFRFKIILFWHLYLFSSIFRYILVKYADRGVVHQGRISPLFEQLYLTAAVGGSLMAYSITMIYHFKQTNSGDQDIPIFLRKSSPLKPFKIIEPIKIERPRGI